MQLSALSRTTSISNSFQPISDSSINSSCVGDKSRPRWQIATNSSMLYAMPPPVPPRVKLGRTTAGKPRVSCTESASASDLAILDRADESPMRVIASLNFSRSSAFAMASGDAPISSTPYLFRHAVVVQVHRAVKRGLAAHRRQNRVRLFLGDDAFDNLPGNRLDVGDVGRFRVRHDRRRIAVDENDLVALVLQCLARLCTGVIELTRLADNDRPSADDQNAFEICRASALRVVLRRELALDQLDQNVDDLDVQLLHAIRILAGRQ